MMSASALLVTCGLWGHTLIFDNKAWLAVSTLTIPKVFSRVKVRTLVKFFHTTRVCVFKDFVCSRVGTKLHESVQNVSVCWSAQHFLKNSPRCNHSSSHLLLFWQSPNVHSSTPDRETLLVTRSTALDSSGDVFFTASDALHCMWRWRCCSAVEPCSMKLFYIAFIAELL